jgi:hypothetical protein
MATQNQTVLGHLTDQQKQDIVKAMEHLKGLGAGKKVDLHDMIKTMHPGGAVNWEVSYKT